MALTLKTKRMDKVPEEVLQEIMTRLPIDSLFQSRYVCKPWHSLIDDPRVPTMHYSHSTKNPNPTSLLIISDFEKNAYTVYYVPDIETCDKAIRLKKLPWTPNFVPYYDIIGSVNGFVCFADTECGFLNLVVCNPVSGDVIKLPNPKCKKGSPYFLGFGFNPKSNEFKVVIAYVTYNRTHEKEENMPVKVLNLGENNWRSIASIRRSQSQVKPSGFNDQNPGIFFNGNLHWLTFNHDFSMAVAIMVFNVEDEKFETIALPESIIGMNCIRLCSKLDLGVLGGCLMVVDSSGESLHVWLMKVYGLKESWVLEFVIPSNNGAEVSQRSQPLGLQKNGNVVMLCNGFHEADVNVSSYDPITKTHKKLALAGIEGFYEVFPHVGTLVALKDVAAMPHPNLANPLVPSKKKANLQSSDSESGEYSSEDNSFESGDCSESEDMSDFNESNSDDE